jgi:hypothetical protein
VTQEYRRGRAPRRRAARLEFAESVLEHALRSQGDRRFARLELEDAQRSALEAEKLGARGWRVDAAIALAVARLGDREQAYQRAEARSRACRPTRRAGAPPRCWRSSPRADRRRSRRRSARKREWPSQWLSDATLPGGVLERHTLALDRHFAAHHDFLLQLGAFAQASGVLDAGLARFPSSWAMHERLRGSILREKGVDGSSGLRRAARQKARLEGPRVVRRLRLDRDGRVPAQGEPHGRGAGRLPARARALRALHRRQARDAPDL